MKHSFIILITLFLGVVVFSCNKPEQEIITPKITDDHVEVSDTSATFTWKVEWVGNRISVVEVSENEDMSGSQFYGSEEELNKTDFRATANNLKPSTKYYYRFWVWNQSYVNNKFVMEEKTFSTSAIPQMPIGAINGLFSVSDSTQVWFSKGNLQYIGSASTPYWKFADNQWDYLGMTTGQNSSNQNVDRDLFGWGTSGYHVGTDTYNRCYQPYSTGDDCYSYPAINYNFYGYGPSINQSNPNLTWSQYDWGIRNPIQNGGNWPGLWRTMTKVEWQYVLFTRNASKVGSTSDARYTKSKVNGVYGLILFPDIYTHPAGVALPFGINDPGNTGWDYNSYSDSDWEQMESKGCVFLPASGVREGTAVSEMGVGGRYWSTTHYDSEDAYRLYFTASVTAVNYIERYYGFSVRVVCSAQ